MIRLCGKISFAAIKNEAIFTTPILTRSKLEAADEQNGAEMPYLSQI